jgi:hypothetical protein
MRRGVGQVILRKPVWFVLGCGLTVVAAIFLVSREASLWRSFNAQRQVPPLMSAYDDLTQFWGEAAKSLKIEPESAYLQQWKIGYDRNGDILYQTFKIFVDKGTGRHEVYNYSQDKQNSGPGLSASWSRQHFNGSIPQGLVPAHLAFAAIDQIGFRELERHENLRPPLRFWFHSESGTKTYRPIAGGYVVRGSEITPISPEGMIVLGDHGTFGIAEGAVTTTSNSMTTGTRENPGPPVLVVPLLAN